MTNIEDLPDVVLEFILSLISPYQDLHECMRVSKRWRLCVSNVVKIRRRNLNKSITEFDVKWKCITSLDSYRSHTISKRYSHSAAVCDNSMYIFGGCTCSLTTFNDLWKFDLSKREWIRPLATGTYPSPKACSSLAYHNKQLVLFGGWTYPPSYPLYQSWHLFDELHLYDIEKSHWKVVYTTAGPPPTAGHSVSIIDDWMILFGGLSKTSSVDSKKSNDVWKLNLNNLTWTYQKVQGVEKPKGRFGQTQVVLDKKNIFIIGGSGGSVAVYSDAWVLNLSDDNSWKWIPVEIRGKTNKPENIWSNPGCKVGDKLIVLNRLQTETSFSIQHSRSPVEYSGENPSSSSARIDAANRQPDLDVNVNGRRGFLRSDRTASRPQDRNFLGEFPVIEVASNEQNPSLNNNVGIRPFENDDQLSRQQGMMAQVQRFHNNRAALAQKDVERSPLDQTKKNKSPHFLGLYVLDLDHALDEKPYVTWLSPRKFNKGPSETILYSLVEGKSEVIMFGGIQNDIKSLGLLNNEISNSLHLILAKDHII